MIRDQGADDRDRIGTCRTHRCHSIQRDAPNGDQGHAPACGDALQLFDTHDGVRILFRSGGVNRTQCNIGGVRRSSSELQGIVSREPNQGLRQKPSSRVKGQIILPQMQPRVHQCRDIRAIIDHILSARRSAQFRNRFCLSKPISGVQTLVTILQNLHTSLK